MADNIMEIPRVPQESGKLMPSTAFYTQEMTVFPVDNETEPVELPSITMICADAGAITIEGNTPFQQMLGWQTNDGSLEALPVNHEALGDEHDYQEALQYYIENGVPRHFVKTFQNLHGETVHATLVLASTNSHLSQATFIAHNETPQQEQVTQLQTRVTAQELSINSLRKILKRFTHDFKTPITSSRAYAQISANLFNNPNLGFDELKSQVVNYAGRIVRQFDRLKSISEGMPAAETDVKPENFKVFDVAALVSDTVEVARTYDDQRIYEFGHAPGMESQLLGSEGDISIVLNNLLNNARKYSEPTAPITVSIANIEDSETTGKCYVELSVQDRGIGMTKEAMEHIFDDGFRVEEIADKVEGQGIGLASIQEKITKHDGTIQVESELGRGSIFTVRLPLYQQNA